MRLKRLTLAALVFVITVMATGVSAKGVPPFAAVRGNTLLLSGFGDALIEITDPFTRGFFSTAWSPDGSKLAYVTYDLEYNYHLMVMDVPDGAPFEVPTDRLENGFPITFAPDGTLLFVEQGIPGQSPVDAYETTLKAVQPEAGATPEVVGKFTFGTGCGGGSSFPGDWRYSAEAGFGGYGLTLTAIPGMGVVHSTNCGGNSLAVFDPETGEDRLLGEEGLGRAAVSPDLTTIAAIRTTYNEPELIRSLVLVDIASGTVTDVETEAPPDQLAWSPDGTLFYSTREVSGNLAEGLTPDEQEALKNAIGYVLEEIPSYTVTIRHYDPNNGSDRELYRADAYAIGRLDSPMQDLVVFSQIANQGDWVQIMSGILSRPIAESEQLDAVPVTLYLLPPESSTPIEVGADMTQFKLQTVQMS